MDIKKVIGISTLCVSFSNGYAFIANDPRIISHKEWSTGHITSFKITDVAAQGIKQRKLARVQKHFAQGSLENSTLFRVTIPNLRGKIGEEISIGGLSNTYIENFTSSKQTYNLVSVVCVLEITDSCVVAKDSIELLPGDYIEFSKAIAGIAKMSKAGTYHSFITTYVFAENKPTMYGAEAGGFIEIK